MSQFKVGDRVVLVCRHHYRGDRASTGYGPGDAGVVVKLRNAEPTRFLPSDDQHICVRFDEHTPSGSGTHWIETRCVELEDAPSEEEVAEVLASITGGRPIPHCRTCTCHA